MRHLVTPLGLLAAHLLTAQSLLGGMPTPNGHVYAIEKAGGMMYIGGQFSSVDGQPRARLARFNAATGALDSWAPTGLTNTVTTISRVADKLVVGGSFTTVNGQSRMGICLFDMATGDLEPWSDMANFISWRQGVGVQGNDFYYCTFSPSRIVAVNATTGLPTGWQSTPAFQEQGNINAILVADGYVYVGGDFRFLSGPSVYDDLCRFHLATGVLDSTWSPQPQVNNFGVTAIVRTNDHVFVGGDFNVIAGQNRKGVAAFLPTGALASFDQNSSSYEVLSLFPDGDHIWVGGNSSMLGGQTRWRIAQIKVANSAATCWNASSTSSSWSTVQAIHVAGDTVHAGPFGSPALSVFTGGPLPQTPAAITGPASVTPGQTVTYSVPSTPGYTYTWTVAGGTGSSTTNSIQVQWGAGPAGTVSVVVNNPQASNCSSDTVTLQVDITGSTAIADATGTGELAGHLFPNPTTGLVQVRIPATASGAAHVRVFDTVGNEVLAERAGSAIHTLDLTGFPGGLYMVRIQADDAVIVRRLIKQ